MRLLEIGRKIGERYKIISHIGTGGMANVYLGHDLILDRDVAIKVLRYDFQNNKEALRRFQREALSATQLIHPNIVGVYDVDEDNGLQYIIMEYVEGTDLKKFIEKNGNATPEEAVHIMSQVLSAMALAHRNRIIHRDIKPQNLLIDQDNTIKVTDFGIAVALSDTSITQTNTLLGSVHYISPEQARGSMTTIKSDIYALGIVLYELLKGKVPFDGESAVSIALKHFQEPIPSVREQNPSIPQSLENVILKATAKEPIDRYESCEDMLHDLETSLHSSRLNEAVFTPAAMLDETKVLEVVKVPAQAAPTNGQAVEEKTEDNKKKERQSKKNNKKKKVIGFIIFFILLLAAAVIGYAVMNNQEPDPIEMPEIVNVSEKAARLILEANNLVLGDVIEAFSDEIEEGFVIKTEPEAGSLIQVQSEVDLYISKGIEPILFDDYKYRMYTEVRAELRELGFIVEREFAYDRAEEGTILEQSIEPNEEVIPKGTTVILTVSMGEQTFTMDSLEGRDREAVEEFANEYSIYVEFKDDYSDDVAEGLVISQSISPMSNFTSGDSLTVVLSKGPAEPEILTFSRDITIPFETISSNSDGNSGSESSQENSNHIIIYMSDADHNISDVFREFDITGDTKATLNFRILQGESGAFIVERDGKIILEEKNLTE